MNGSRLFRPDHQGETFFRYSDDHGATWSAQHYLIPTRPTKIDGRIQERGAWFCGQGAVRVGSDLWLPFSKNEMNAAGTAFDRTETWFWKSSNILSERDAAKINWVTLPEGENGALISSESGVGSGGSQGSTESHPPGENRRYRLRS